MWNWTERGYITSSCRIPDIQNAEFDGRSRIMRNKTCTVLLANHNHLKISAFNYKYLLPV